MECDLNTFSGRKAANSFGVWIFARSHRRQITPVFVTKTWLLSGERMCCLVQVQNVEVLVEITRIKASMRHQDNSDRGSLEFQSFKEALTQVGRRSPDRWAGDWILGRPDLESSLGWTLICSSQ